RRALRAPAGSVDTGGRTRGAGARSRAHFSTRDRLARAFTGLRCAPEPSWQSSRRDSRIPAWLALGPGKGDVEGGIAVLPVDVLRPPAAATRDSSLRSE